MNGMNASNLSSFAYVSEAYLKGPVKAVFVNFPGLGSTEMKSALDIPDVKLANEGVLFVPDNPRIQRQVGEQNRTFRQTCETDEEKEDGCHLCRRRHDGALQPDEIRDSR
jgi:hypothetical protein